MKKTIITTCLLSFCLGSSPQNLGAAAGPPAPTAPVVVVSTTVDLPAYRTTFYHNVANAKELYEAGKQSAIDTLVGQMESLKANPERLTKKVFWNLLKLLGKKRKEIAKNCSSQDIDDFGALRMHNSINTGLGSYTVMREFVVRETTLAIREGKMNIDLSAVERETKMASARLKALHVVFNGFLMADSKSKHWASECGYNAYPEEHFDIDHMFKMHFQSIWTPGSVGIWKKSFYENDTVSRIFYGDYVDKQKGIHTNLFTVDSAEENSQAISTLFTLFQQFVRTGELPVLFAFFHKFAVTMPYARGSCAINEWILEAGCRLIGVSVLKQRLYAEFDQRAQISERDVFVRFMMERFQSAQG